MKFATQVKTTLLDLVHGITSDPNPYVKNPGKDFVRNRKLGFETTIKLLLSLSNQSSEDELLDFFNHSDTTPSLSALIQQRDKILPKFFPQLFKLFNEKYPGTRDYKGHQLLACDGSDINIFHNPNDPSTYYRNPGTTQGFNEMHIDGLYDLCNRVYKQINIVGRHDQNEQRALVNFMKNYSTDNKCIFIADRNYSTWNVMANAAHRKLHFLIRTKDITSNGILHSFHIDENIGEFDRMFSVNLVRLKRCIDHSNLNEYHVMANNVTFDFIPPGTEGVFKLKFRAVRIQINDNRYESIITNLDENEFPPSEIKKLYSMRWGIETSYRELKHTLALNHFHSKKVDHIHQEIFAKVIMYNFCSVITLHVAEIKQKKKHIYQINFSRAIKECKKFFSIDVDPPDVESVIKKYMLPIRFGRSNPRKVKIRERVSFLYR